jgi:hypothetical protein
MQEIAAEGKQQAPLAKLLVLLVLLDVGEGSVCVHAI